MAVEGLEIPVYVESGSPGQARGRPQKQLTAQGHSTASATVGAVNRKGPRGAILINWWWNESCAENALRAPWNQAAADALANSRYETIRCSRSSHRQQRKHALMSLNESVIVTGDWSSGTAAIASGSR